MAQYAGADTFPVNFTIADDAVPPTASVFNVGLEALADRTIYLRRNPSKLGTIAVTASTTIVVPALCTRLIVRGCGGGGGGGGGSVGINIEHRWIAGGGGGGGAVPGWEILTVVPGETLNVDIGAGGAAGTSSASGGDGGNTIIRRGATVLAVFPGAQSGGGSANHVEGLIEHFVLGGMPRAGALAPIRVGLADVIRNFRYDTSGPPWSTTSMLIPVVPGSGGYGASGSTLVPSSAGSPNAIGVFAAGAAGTKGADFGAGRGGGGGGGGAAGPYGAGGSGGNGGVPGGGTNSATGGASAGANTGAGGGGGGSGAYYSGATVTTGAFGGAGGSGALVVTYVEVP